jgi:hypothetical protein
MNLIDISKNNKLHLIFITFFILLSSNANNYFNSYYTLFVLAIIFGGFLQMKYKLGINIFLYILVFVFIYAVGIYTTFNSFPNIGVIVRVSSYIFLAYCFSLYGPKNFMILFEKVVFKLILISLGFFLFEIIFTSIFTSVISRIASILGTFFGERYEVSKTYHNIFIYTINYSELNPVIFSRRNSGFAFEPGQFSIFISVGLLFNLILKSYNFDRKQLIYLLALLTTESTTGLLMLILIALIVVFSRKYQSLNRVLIIPIVILSIIFIARSPLVYDKISSNFSSGRTLKQYEQFSKDSKYQMSLGRFVSVYYSIERVFERSPFFGYFGQEDKGRNTGVDMPSGIANTIYTFGFIGLIIVLIGFARSAHMFTLDSRFFIRMLFIVLFLIPIISFPITNTVFYWYFVLSGYLNKKVILHERFIPHFNNIK